MKSVHFSGKGRQLIHNIIINVIKVMLISCIKVDHALYSINYGILFSVHILFICIGHSH